MTEKHQLLTNDQFEEQFRNCTLPKPLLTDDAYFRLAFIHTTKYGKNKAIVNLQRQLAAYEIKNGNHFRFTDENIEEFILLLDKHLSSETKKNYNELLLTFPNLKADCLDLIDEEAENVELTNES